MPIKVKKSLREAQWIKVLYYDQYLLMVCFFLFSFFFWSLGKMLMMKIQIVFTRVGFWLSLTSCKVKTIKQKQ